MHISEIWRHPVKSIGGERLDEADITTLGIDGDRQWGVRDPATGNILTGRREPTLLMATATIRDDLPVITTTDGEVLEGDLPNLSHQVSEWLDRPVALVPAGDRGGTFENPEDIEREADWVSWTGPAGAFHDSTRTRVSVVSTATLDGRDIRRFRCNLVVDGNGMAEGEEDRWVEHVLTIGGQVRLDVRKQIDRCIMVTRAQPGLPRDLDVIRRLVRERDKLLGIGALVASEGRVAEGDPVTVAT